jgi:hypothetical protein
MWYTDVAYNIILLLVLRHYTIVDFLHFLCARPDSMCTKYQHHASYNKGRSPSNGKLSDFSFYIDSQKSAHRHTFYFVRNCVRWGYYLLFWMNCVADLLWRSFYLRHSSIGSFVERDFFIRILFQVYFDFA